MASLIEPILCLLVEFPYSTEFCIMGSFLDIITLPALVIDGARLAVAYRRSTDHPHLTRGIVGHDVVYGNTLFVLPHI